MVCVDLHAVLKHAHQMVCKVNVCIVSNELMPAVPDATSPTTRRTHKTLSSPNGARKSNVVYSSPRTPTHTKVTSTYASPTQMRGVESMMITQDVLLNGSQTSRTSRRSKSSRDGESEMEFVDLAASGEGTEPDAFDDQTDADAEGETDVDEALSVNNGRGITDTGQNEPQARVMRNGNNGAAKESEDGEDVTTRNSTVNSEEVAAVCSHDHREGCASSTLDSTPAEESTLQDQRSSTSTSRTGLKECSQQKRSTHPFQDTHLTSANSRSMSKDTARRRLFGKRKSCVLDLTQRCLNFFNRPH